MRAFYANRQQNTLVQNAAHAAGQALAEADINALLADES